MEIKYNIIRSKRKTVGIAVKEGAVTVRAPYGISDKEIKKIVEKHSAWIEKKLEDSLERKKEELSESDIRYLRSLSEIVLIQKTWRYAALLGLRPGKVRISTAKSRFGSCSNKGSISLSLYVMMYPEAAQDLVIIHELCHLRHMNHSKEFYGLLSSFLPDHKARKKLLCAKYRMSIGEVKRKYGEIN